MCLQGGIHGKISLTAYVVAALLETGITTDVSNPTGRHEQGFTHRFMMSAV